MARRRAGDSPPREGRKRPSLDGDTPRRLILAARKAFARYGYDRTTNEDIAEIAQTTTGAIYHYFESKADLFTAATKEVEEILLAGLRAAVAGATTSVDKLHRLLDAAVGLGEQGEDLARFVAIAPVELERREEFRELHQSLFGEVVTFFAEIVREGKANGEIASDVDPQSAADMLLAALFGIALQAGLYADQISLRNVVEVFQRLIEGRLFTAPPDPPAAGAPRSRALRGLRR